METGKTTDVTQSLLNLTENSSGARIRTLELNEYCKHAKTNLKVFKTKIQSLSAANSEATRTRNEFLARKKVNAINLKSLIQTRNEFYNYKCDVKIDYVEEEVKMKNRRFKYNEFTGRYSVKWKAFEGEYNKIGAASEIFVLEEGNTFLNAELIRIQYLMNKTEKDYIREIRNLRNILTNKIVEFIKEYLMYSNFLILNQNIRNIGIQIKTLLKDKHAKELANQKPRLKVNILKKNPLQPDIQRERNEESFIDSFTVNLKALDNINLPLDGLPLEVLEIPNEDYSFTGHSKDNFTSLVIAGNSDLEIDIANKKFYPPDMHNLNKKVIANKNASNIDNAHSGANKYMAVSQIEGSTKAGKFSRNNNNINTASIFRNAQYKGPRTSSSLQSDGVSQYWKQTQSGDTVRVTQKESRVKELNESRISEKRENMMYNGKEVKEKISKKIKFSTGKNDVALLVPSSEYLENSKPISINYGEDVEGNGGDEEQIENPQHALTTQTSSKVTTLRTGLWTENHASDETSDENKDGNVLSFFSDDRTKPGSSSSIFTLF